MQREDSFVSDPGGAAQADRAFGELLGQALRAGRRQFGWSQRELADRSGLSKSAIGRLEVGDGRSTLLSARHALSAVGLGLLVADQEAGLVWSAVHAIDGDLERACDRAGRQLPAHWFEEPLLRGEPGWRISRRALRGGPILSTDQPWTYHRDAWDYRP
jgi:transcriptional regulator with XRE-family HTH domain